MAHDLIEAVDVSLLKRTLEEAGCVLPSNFSIEVEKHLRILMARFLPERSKVSYSSTREMSQAMRSLFKGKIYPSVAPDCFVTEDKYAVRRWHRDFYNPGKRAEKTRSKNLDPYEKRATVLSHLLSTPIMQSEITNLIPRTIRNRSGSMKYLIFKIGLVEKDLQIDISTAAKPSKASRCASALSDAIAQNLLLIKGDLVAVSVANNHLILFNEDVEIFFK